MLIIKKIDNSASMDDVNKGALDPSIDGVSVDATYFYDKGLIIKNLLATDFIKELPWGSFTLNINLIATRSLNKWDRVRIGESISGIYPAGESISDIYPKSRIILSSANFTRKTLNEIRNFAFGGLDTLFDMDIAANDSRDLSYEAGHMIFSPPYLVGDVYEQMRLAHYANNGVPVMLDWPHAESISRLNACVHDKSKILLLTRTPEDV